MKLSLDELLTDADVSAICVAEDHPLSLDRIMHRTISKANGQAPTRRRKRLSLPLIAAVIAALLATTVFAINTSGHTIFLGELVLEVDENGQIIYPEPEIGVTVSISDVTPTGCYMTYSLEGPNDWGLFTNDNEFYYLAVLTENGWDILSILDDYDPSDDLYYQCENHHSFYLDWSDKYGELSPGTYKIEKGFETRSNGRTSELYYLGAEFAIGGIIINK